MTPEPGNARPSLLIADDDSVVRDALAIQLAAGFRLIGVAADTAEAVELAELHHPDAALIDVEMPGGGAREAVPRIVACSPLTCQVILSGDECDSVVGELLSAGALCYMRKGVPASTIAKTLMDALEVRARNTVARPEPHSIPVASDAVPTSMGGLPIRAPSYAPTEAREPTPSDRRI